MFFSEFPLFSITEHQSRISLGNLSAMSQLASNMGEFCEWLTSNWEERVYLSCYPGPRVPDVDRTSRERDHDDFLHDQISNSPSGK